jgi:hypothetical protein
MYAPDPEEKFDYQNMDVKLYLALRKLTQEYQALEADVSGSLNWQAVKEAERAMCEFEQSFGPLPDWAVSRNWDYSLVPGAQLCTKDGRRTGNAHIVKMGEGIAAGPVFVHTFECLTDAGSKFTFTEVELLEAFTIGDWISDPARIIRDFDRNGEFSNEQ